MGRSRAEEKERVLFVAPWLRGGGGQAVMRDLAQRMDLAPDLVVLFGTDDHLDSISAHFNNLHVLGYSRSFLGVLRAAWKLRSLISPYSSIFSLMRGSTAVLGIFSARALPRKRFAVSFHQLPSQDVADGLFGKIENLFVRRATRMADLVTAPSPRAVDELRELRWVEQDRIYFDRNPLPEMVAHSPRTGELERLRLLFIGRLEEQKGLDRFLPLLANVNISLEMRIVGDGPQLSFLKEIAASASSDSVRIDFWGRSENVQQLLAWCDALVLPSRWELNPVTLWEAWLTGRPVLAWRIPVFDDLAAEGPVILFDSADELRGALHLLSLEDFRNDAERQSGESVRTLSRPTLIERFFNEPGRTGSTGSEEEP